ncbi:PCI domain-containing protein 2 isoform X2 [Urocitellus parryii]
MKRSTPEMEHPVQSWYLSSTLMLQTHGCRREIVRRSWDSPLWSLRSPTICVFKLEAQESQCVAQSKSRGWRAGPSGTLRPAPARPSLFRPQQHSCCSPTQEMASPEEKCQQVLEPPYDEMFAAHLRCTYAVGNHDFIEAYKCQTVIVQSFLRAFQAHKEENWALPVMYAVALDLRVFANNADQQLVKKGKSKVGDMLEKAAELLMSCFRVCASDTRAGIEDSKKWGMLFLVNQLFKIYFKINKLHLCKPLIRAIDSSNLRDDYSTAQRVTYKYYVGRKAMFDSDFKQAEEYLSFAFEHCHRSSQKNKRMILIYLLPVKMLLGHMPTVELLRKYHLMQFADVTRAVSEGNLLLLNEALARHETFFIRCGIFLILEKLKIITYRNLFKKVYLLLRTHQLSLEAFLVALKFMHVEDVDIDEGHIKGYISHQHQKLVVSKQNPFPPLSTVC